nr:hypothetical protein [Tanacetum cinerariifolium]
MALWIHGTILDRPTVTFYGDIKRDDGNPSRANIKQALGRFNQRRNHFFQPSCNYTLAPNPKILQRLERLLTLPYTPRCIQNFRKAKDHDIKFYCSNDMKSKIKILDHKHAEGTEKNSQDNKVLRREVKTYAMTTP